MAVMLYDSISSRIAPILGSIKSTGVPAAERGVAGAKVAHPFVTISREAGAGGVTLAKALVERLNGIDDGGRPWQSFDRELIEKIAADHHIAAELISRLEESSHNWLTEFFGGITLRDDATPSDVRVFHSVAATVRALAQAGRVVMVGVGSGQITANMAGGIHIRLVADFRYRVRFMMRLFNLSATAAEAEVKRRDAARAMFFRRFFPETALTPERFTMTMNASALSEGQMVAAIVAALTTPPAG
jgi:hypothetical protein